MIVGIKSKLSIFYFRDSCLFVFLRVICISSHRYRICTLFTFKRNIYFSHLQIVRSSYKNYRWYHNWYRYLVHNHIWSSAKQDCMACFTKTGDSHPTKGNSLSIEQAERNRYSVGICCDFFFIILIFLFFISLPSFLQL